MTDRMTERFESIDTPDESGTDTPIYEGIEPDSPSETVTRSAAVDDLSLGSGTGSAPSAGASATEHAGAVAQDAKESAKGVASTATSEAKDVAREARTQVRQLFTQLTGEASDQASGQTQRAVGGLRSLSSELSDMAESQQGQSGLAADLARQGASRLDAAAGWLDGRQPGEILEEVRSFARRRPGAFIAGAAILGLVGGRMTRGLTGDSSSTDTAPGAGAGPVGTRTGDAAYGGAAHGDQTYGDAAYGDPAYGTGAARPAEPVDLGGGDPTRVDAGIDPATYTHPGMSAGADAGIDPATYTHPGASTGVAGESR